MTMPEGEGVGIQAQVLMELGKLSTSQAVANTKLDSLLQIGADHETRIRLTEQELAKSQGSRDGAARWLGIAAVLAAIGSLVLTYVHH